MDNRSKEQMKKAQQKDQRQRETENAPGQADKKLGGPDRPST
ncbi:spore protein [Anaerobacillus arseniciselenatis]|nr:spore protein [Anaerobacillus arseniciselenatis]